MDSKESTERVRCPVCNHRTLSKRGIFEICPVCYWEDEGDVVNPDEPTGGPNGELSLAHARLNYKRYGAVDKRFVDKVRPPQVNEV